MTARSLALIALAASLCARGALAQLSLPETRLPLVLVGTVVAASPERSLAVVSSGGKSSVVRVGEQVGGVAIHAIEQDAVVISRQGQLERLSFGTVVAAGGTAGPGVQLAATESGAHEVGGADPSRAALRASRRAVSNEQRARRTRAQRAGSATRASRAAASNNDALIAELSGQARFTPMLDENGKLRGVALMGIVPDSTLERFGLQSGDVVIAIGGVRVDNSAKAYEALRALDVHKGVTVTVERRGALTQVAVPPGAL